MLDDFTYVFFIVFDLVVFISSDLDEFIRVGVCVSHVKCEFVRSCSSSCQVLESNKKQSFEL